MNALLWILQSILALLYLAGGAYKAFGFDEVAPSGDVETFADHIQ